MMADVRSKRLIECWVALAALLLAAGVCAAGGRTSSSKNDEFLKAHNKARRAVGVGPLRWSENLADQAIRWADTANCQRPASCDFSEAASKSPMYGANQAVTNLMESAERVVGGWVEEGRGYYNQGNSSCAAGHEEECGSFRQVVCRKTLEVGCGTANCGKDGSLAICLYFPRGNECP